MKEKITVMIADDHPLWHNAMKQLLNEYPEFEIIGNASNGIELIKLVKKKQPDLILLDIRMPEMDGDATLKIIKETFPDIYVIILSDQCDTDEMVIYYIENGASSAMPKAITSEKIVAEIVGVMAGEPNFSEGVLNELLSKNGKHNVSLENLSKQEKNILLEFCKEKSVKEVATDCQLSVGTVKFHKTNIYRKTKSVNLAGLTKYAFKRGWL